MRVTKGGLETQADFLLSTVTAVDSAQSVCACRVVCFFFFLSAVLFCLLLVFSSLCGVSCAVLCCAGVTSRFCSSFMDRENARSHTHTAFKEDQEPKLPPLFFVSSFRLHSLAVARRLAWRALTCKPLAHHTRTHTHTHTRGQTNGHTRTKRQGNHALIKQANSNKNKQTISRLFRFHFLTPHQEIEKPRFLTPVLFHFEQQVSIILSHHKPQQQQQPIIARASPHTHTAQRTRKPLWHGCSWRLFCFVFSNSPFHHKHTFDWTAAGTHHTIAPALRCFDTVNCKTASADF